MVQLSNIERAAFAFVPGQMEHVQRKAENNGNMAWDGLARGVIISRNALYVGVAVTALGAYALAVSSQPVLSAVVTVGGAGFSAFSAKMLKERMDAFEWALRAVQANK